MGASLAPGAGNSLAAVLETLDAEEDELPEGLEGDGEIGGKVKVNLADMDLPSWEHELKRDLEVIEALLASMHKITPEDDAKLQHLKAHVLEKIANPINLGNRKVLIFTAFADTADYLYANLAPELLARPGHLDEWIARLTTYAAGMVAAAHGNDGGGSIRVPASHCGLYGLKPSRGLISHGPTRGDVWMGAAHEHVLTRSVRDSAALVDVSAGAHAGDPYPNVWQTGAAVEALRRASPRLRIGIMTQCPGARLPLHEDCRDAVTHAARLLASLGHQVEEAYPHALDEADDERHFMRMVAAWTAHDLDAAIAAGGEPLREGDLEPHTAIVYQLGKSLGAPDYLRAQVWLQGWARRIAAWWDTGYDLLLTPVAAAPPQRIGSSPATADDPMGPLRGTVPYIAFTAPFNVTGQPAASIPLAWNREGLPIGVQLVAALGEDTRLLQISAELERAAPWAQRRPPAPA